MGKYSYDWDGLEKKMEDAKSRKGAGDIRFYMPKFSKDGTFSALIRFLPGISRDSTPIVYTQKHNFRGRNGYFNENCPTAINGPCPICSYNQLLWKDPSQQNTARKYGRRPGIIANILVINDPQTPENNNKVFLFQGSKQILKIQEEARNPSDTLTKKIPIFDFYKGANFILKGTRVKLSDDAADKATRPDWGTSKFDSPSAIGDDDFIEKYILPNIKDVMEFLNPELYKSPDALSAAFKAVTGISIGDDADKDKPAEPNEFQKSQSKEDTAYFDKTKSVKSTQPVESYPESNIDESDNTEEDNVAFFNKVKGK